MPGSLQGGGPPRRAALQGASRIFTQGGEPKDHEVFVQNDRLEAFFGNQQWPTLRRYVEKVVAAVNEVSPGSYTEVEIPLG
jgi:hypothetical protein